MPIGATPMLGGVNTMGLLTRACGWLALSSLIAAQAQTGATTTQTSAASANFTYVSDDGCILNEIIVFANRTTVVTANAPRTTGEVTYTRYRYDYCEDVDLGTDLGSSAQPAFSGDLNRASRSEERRVGKECRSRW